MIRFDDERGGSAHSSSILPIWKIQYWKEMHGGLPCITFHLNPARRSPYMPNGPNLRPEITEKAARPPAWAYPS